MTPFEFSETDGRNFEWPESAVNVAQEMTLRYATLDEVMQFLRPYVKEALAEAWDEGFEEGTGYGAYLEGGYGHYPTPVNPYLHPAPPDDSVAPPTPPASGY